MPGDDDNRVTVPGTRSARGLYALWLVVLLLSFVTGGYAFGYLVDYEGVGTENGPNVLGVVEDAGDGFANVGNTETSGGNTDSSVGNTAGNTRGMSINPLLSHGVDLSQTELLVGIRTAARDAAATPVLVVVG